MHRGSHEKERQFMSGLTFWAFSMIRTTRTFGMADGTGHVLEVTIGGDLRLRQTLITLATQIRRVAT